MTEDDLKAIEEVCNQGYGPGREVTRTLIAEVRRLQAQCGELTHRWIKQNAADAHEAQLEASLEP